jgi:hypothetical protein
MPITSKHGSEGEEFSFYADLIQFKAVEMALDHFFMEVVQGNVPLTDTPDLWWEREIIPERVNRYSQPWCLLFEALSMAMSKMTNNGIPLDKVEFDTNLKAIIHTRYGDEDITWVKNEDSRF